MARRSYAGGAVPSTLAAPITTGSSTAVMNAAIGYPDGSTGPFAIAIDRGLATEEKILVLSRTGTSLTFQNRGYDGTVAQNHSAGAVIELVITATDLDEANAHIAATAGVHGLAGGDTVVGVSRAQTLVNKTISGLVNTLTDVAQASVTGLVEKLAALDATDTALAGAVNSVVAGLGNVYNKSQVYTKTEVDQSQADQDTTFNNSLSLKAPKTFPAFLGGATVDGYDVARALIAPQRATGTSPSSTVNPLGGGTVEIASLVVAHTGTPLVEVEFTYYLVERTAGVNGNDRLAVVLLLNGTAFAAQSVEMNGHVRSSGGSARGIVALPSGTATVSVELQYIYNDGGPSQQYRLYAASTAPAILTVRAFNL